MRITRAAVELHGTVGPAATTVTEIAKRAGVSRMTVYHHFPTHADLFAACSSHWAALNPFPDPSKWDEIDDPIERLGRGLGDLYRWYGEKQGMLGKVFRDLPRVPALADVMNGFWSGYVDQLVAILGHGWDGAAEDAGPSDAALRLAVDFNTWKSLSVSGLDDQRLRIWSLGWWRESPSPDGLHRRCTRAPYGRPTGDRSREGGTLERPSRLTRTLAASHGSGRCRKSGSPDARQSGHGPPPSGGPAR